MKKDRLVCDQLYENYKYIIDSVYCFSSAFRRRPTGYTRGFQRDIFADQYYGSTLVYEPKCGGGEFAGLSHRVHIFTRDETWSVYLPTQLERTLQLYW
jgi:hypothetical protein